jgi:N-methylhydantoinase A/oxoprolinase/acetone carboxylase beta subunit
LSSDFFIGGYNEGLAIRIPVLDIKEVGTGGGSIA